MLFGNNDYMNGSHGMYVIKGYDVIIFVNFAARNYAFYDFAKNTFIHGKYLSC